MKICKKIKNLHTVKILLHAIQIYIIMIFRNFQRNTGKIVDSRVVAYFWPFSQRLFLEITSKKKFFQFFLFLLFCINDTHLEHSWAKYEAFTLKTLVTVSKRKLVPRSN